MHPNKSYVQQSGRKGFPMEKEVVLKWLRQCSDVDQDAVCAECPFASCEDCAGELLKEAAQVLHSQ